MMNKPYWFTSHGGGSDAVRTYQGGAGASYHAVPSQLAEERIPNRYTVVLEDDAGQKSKPGNRELEPQAPIIA